MLIVHMWRPMSLTKLVRTDGVIQFIMLEVHMCRKFHTCHSRLPSIRYDRREGSVHEWGPPPQSAEESERSMHKGVLWNDM